MSKELIGTAPPKIIGLSKAEQAKQDEIRRKKARKAEEKERAERMQRTLKQFSEWLSDESYFEDYFQYELLGRDTLIRVFRYREEKEVKSSILLDFDSDKTAASAYDRNYPIAKVIAVGPQVTLFQPGDVVTLPDNIAGSSRNPEFEAWVESLEEAKKSRPPGKVGPPPPEYVDNLIHWKKYLFQANKLSPKTEDDFLTYLIPDNFLKTKIKTDEELEDR